MSKTIVMTPGAQGFIPNGAVCAEIHEAPPAPVSAAPALPSPPAAPVIDVAKERAQARAAAIRETEARLHAEWAGERKQWQEKWQLFEKRYAQLLQDIERQITEQLITVSVKVAEAVLRHALPDHQMLTEVIRETLKPISDLQGVKVRLHPEDAARLLGRAANDPIGPLADRLELIPDSSLKPGDMLLESRNGYFNGRLEERLKLLEEKLRERYRKAHGNDPTT